MQSSFPGIRDIAIKKRDKVPILLKSVFKLGETDKYKSEFCDCSVACGSAALVSPDILLEM